MKKLLLATLLLCVCTFSAIAQSAKTYVKDQHYTELNPAYETENKEQVIVYEFFGYKCPHCSSFQAFMKPWHKKLPQHIKLVRIPVMFQRGWDVLAKAYYTAETMGFAEKTHQALFDAIHISRKRFNTIEDVADWYEENYSVDRQAFLATAESFMIDSKLRQSDNLMKRMKVTSTPAIVVNGKFKPIPKKLETRNGILDLATFLANQEAIAMGLVK